MKTLIETNVHLKNPEKLEIANKLSTKSSCGVEGIQVQPNYSEKYKVNTLSKQAVLNKIKKRLNRN